MMVKNHGLNKNSESNLDTKFLLLRVTEIMPSLIQLIISFRQFQTTMKVLLEV